MFSVSTSAGRSSVPCLSMPTMRRTASRLSVSPLSISSKSSANTRSASALSAGDPETVISLPRTRMSLSSDDSTSLSSSSPGPSRLTISRGSLTVILVWTRAPRWPETGIDVAVLGEGLFVMGRPLALPPLSVLSFIRPDGLVVDGRTVRGHPMVSSYTDETPQCYAVCVVCPLQGRLRTGRLAAGLHSVAEPDDGRDKDRGTNGDSATVHHDSPVPMLSNVQERIRVPMHHRATDQGVPGECQRIQSPDERVPHAYDVAGRHDEPVEEDDQRHEVVQHLVDPRNRRVDARRPVR